MTKIKLTIHEKGSFLKDVVLGASDGVVTTFAVVAGSIGASLPNWVLIVMGVANVASDGLSMAAGSYLGVKSEVDYEKSKGSRNKEGSPVTHAVGTFIAFCIAGGIPIIPYILALDHRLELSIILVAFTLFAVGSFRAKMAEKVFWKGGLEMLIVGGLASSAAFIVGHFLRNLPQ
jgi:vacuolar iron transporter family protein